jgi:hypothetical protein
MLCHSVKCPKEFTTCISCGRYDVGWFKHTISCTDHKNFLNKKFVLGKKYTLSHYTVSLFDN